MRTQAWQPRRTAGENLHDSVEQNGWTFLKIFRYFHGLQSDHGGYLYSVRRLFLFLILGACLSSVGVLLTEDEYYEGPRSNNAIRCLQQETEETSLSVHKVHIAFKDVGCSIKSSVETKTVLRNVSGEIHPGRLTAILGQSGSGKTTFAYCLLGKGKRYCSPQHGTIFLNGYPRNLESFLDRVGFVPQDDVLHADLTVEEAIAFSAKWRLPRKLNDEQRQQVIEDTLKILDLDKIRNQRIGNVRERGISGGERKRTSIGMELVARPSVLIMDEPTTSLDSASAFQLVKMLRAVADSGVSVVAVLHQPSERVYNLFHDLILLQKGEAAFVGARENVMGFLTHAGYQVPQMKFNSAEYLLDVLAELEQPVLGKECRNVVQKNVSPECYHHLPALWRNYSQSVKIGGLNPDRDTWGKEFGGCFETFPQFSESETMSQKFLSLLNICDKNNPKGYFCSLLFTDRSNDVPFYWVLQKPGLKRQLMLWFWQNSILLWRRGLAVELVVVCGMASGVAFVRSFNNAWSRKANSNFFLSISISLLGTFGAVLTDDIAPVKRAASAGMLLGSHEWAALVLLLLKGYVFAQIFSIVYFTVLWSRTGEWCTTPDEDASWLDFSAMTRLHSYYHFAHIILLQYLAASAVGTVVCVIVNHDLSMSYIASAGVLVIFHVFALFSPNRNQIKQDSVLFSCINVAPVVEFLCAISYVRYFMEAIMLWDPDTEDKNGRNFILRYFGYKPAHTSYCCNILFLWGLLAQSLRFVIFSYRNSNDFHSLYDTPLFMIFIFKVLSCYALALIIMLLIQAWYFPWIASVIRKRNRNATSDKKDL